MADLMKLADVALLWGRAAGRCSAPGCDIQLTLELPNTGRLIVGEHAHIIPRSPKGPRGDGNRTGSDDYENRILLCPVHHRIVDRAPDDHPRELLLTWKADHEQRMRGPNGYVTLGPVVWSVPHPLNRRVAGRDQALRALKERLCDQPVQVLHGLSGVGKSQIAATFAHRHAADYRVVYWVDASPGALERDLRVFAADVGLEIAEDLTRARRAVGEFLATHSDYLLILDRAPDLATVDPWLPPSPGGHIVVTSTSPAWRRLGHPERIEPLDDAVGAAYLEERTGKPDGVALARILGGLPLALEQAASYVETTGVTLERYRHLYEAKAIDLLGTEPRADDYDATVLVTLSLALAAVDIHHHPSAMPALRMLSYLDASPLPRGAVCDLLAAAPGAGDGPDEIEAELAIGALAERSVVALDPSNVTMHTLVAQVARRGRSDERLWVEAVQRGLRSTLAGDAQLASSFTTYRPLVEHVVVACAHAQRLGVANEDTVYLLDRVATHLQQRGMYEQARDLFEQALRIDGVPALLRCSVRLNHSALVDFLDSDEALRLMYTLLEEVGREPTGDVDLDTLRADLQQNLALAHHNHGESETARELIERARTIYDRVVAEKDRPEAKNFIDALMNDGLIAWAASDYKHALVAWRGALSLAEAAADPDPLLVARCLSNLGVLFENLERPDDSEDNHRRALKLRRQHLPEEHPDIVISLTALAGAHRARGEIGHPGSFATALEFDEEAESVADSRGDEGLVSLALNGQALDLWLGGHAATALPLARRALEIRRRTQPIGHPTLLQALVNLGRISLTDGDLEGASTCFCEVLEQWRNSDLPAHHLQVARAHEGLGNLAATRGDGTAACREFRLAAQAFVELFGPDSPAATRAQNHVEEHCEPPDSEPEMQDDP
jgi:tetratricopeptide (TPR) repeat protein